LGQKVHPIGFRLGIYRTWDSVWFANKGNFPALVLEDRRIREFIKKDPELRGAGIAGIDIKRAANKLTIKIHTSRPGCANRRSTPNWWRKMWPCNWNAGSPSGGP